MDSSDRCLQKRLEGHGLHRGVEWLHEDPGVWLPPARQGKGSPEKNSPYWQSWRKDFCWLSWPGWDIFVAVFGKITTLFTSFCTHTHGSSGRCELSWQLSGFPRPHSNAVTSLPLAHTLWNVTLCGADHELGCQKLLLHCCMFSPTGVLSGCIQGVYRVYTTGPLGY